MKTFNLGLIISAMVLSALLLNLNSCKKQDQNQTKDVIGVDDESTNVMNHILEFKEEMEYYHNNPGLKTDYKKEIMQTITDWEASMNMSFCYSYLDLSDVKSYETVIDIPLVGPDSIFMRDVADKYYNDIILIVQQDYFNNQFSNKRLISVDLEPINGGDSLLISALIGNNSSLLLPQYDWKYGKEAGTCDGNYYVTESDAAIELAKNVRQYFYEESPAGYKWSFLNIETKIIDALTQNENGDYIYINEDDETPLDNYKDYLIFYANSDTKPIVDSTECIPQYNEYQFYKQNYINITQNICGEKYFKECLYEGYDEFDATNNLTQLFHKLKTIYGTRIKVNFNVPTDDIATY